MTTGSSSALFAALGPQYQAQMRRAAQLEIALRKEAIACGALIVHDEIIWPRGYVPKTIEQHKKELGWE